MTELLNSSEPYVGEIILFAGNFAPRGWAVCDGRLLNPADYSILFSILGTTFGGDGRSTFGLPDLRGRVPIGTGNGAALTARTLGQQGGAENATLNVNNVPSHSHPLKASSAAAAQNAPTGNNLAVQAGSAQYQNATANVSMAADAIGNTGSGTPFPTLPPFTVLNFIIALQGRDPRAEDSRIITTANP